MVAPQQHGENMQEGEGAQQGWGDTQKTGSLASAVDKRLQLPAGNSYSGCHGGCMRPAFWEPSAYWVMKIQKLEFPELLWVESDHLTPRTWMNGLSFSPLRRYGFVVLQPEWLLLQSVPEQCHHSAFLLIRLRPVLANPHPSRAPAGWSLTRPFKLYLKLAMVRQKQERTCFSFLFSCVIYFINVGFVVFRRQIFRTAPVFWQVISCAIKLSGVSVGLRIKQLTKVIKTSGYSRGIHCFSMGLMILTAEKWSPSAFCSL